MSCAMRGWGLCVCVCARYNKQGAQWKVRLSRGAINSSFDKNYELQSRMQSMAMVYEVEGCKRKGKRKYGARGAGAAKKVFVMAHRAATRRGRR